MLVCDRAFAPIGSDLVNCINTNRLARLAPVCVLPFVLFLRVFG